MQPLSRPGKTSAGFTLFELLLVVLILGILSAIVVPELRSQRRDAETATLGSSVTQVQMVLEVQKQKLGTGSYPPAILPEWFVDGILPLHPDKLAGVPPVETVSAPGQTHPADKLMHAGCAGAYWYNTANGAFRARVKEQPTGADTLSFYNDVNHSTLASLSDPD
jgi:prepilin-type N-terminal cleavage/methylation domain-containing protein